MVDAIGGRYLIWVLPKPISALLLCPLCLEKDKWTEINLKEFSELLGGWYFKFQCSKGKLAAFNNRNTQKISTMCNMSVPGYTLITDFFSPIIQREDSLYEQPRLT